jgi:hypothetical protein
MAESERSTTSRRSGFVPICASSWSLLCVLLAGCLNPMPEEFPARPANDSAPDRGPSPGGSGDFGPQPTDGSPNTDAEEEPLPPGVEASPEAVDPADSPDAGPTDAAPADAGPPDELVSDP